MEYQEIQLTGYIKVMEVLTEFFILSKKEENFTFTHKRLVQEHKYLTAKYKARSEAGKKGADAKWKLNKYSLDKDVYIANSKTMAPIPIPSPIPNKNMQSIFEKFWSLLDIKKGSKFLAGKRYAVHCAGMEPTDIALAFNRYASTVKDKEFLAHVSTWINQRRFEDETNNKVDITNVIGRLKKLGYTHKGRESNFEQFSKNGKNYKINLLDKDFIIQED